MGQGYVAAPAYAIIGGKMVHLVPPVAFGDSAGAKESRQLPLRHRISRALTLDGRIKVSVRTAVVVLVSTCVVVTVTPQIVAWYLCAEGSTRTAAEHLLRSVANSSQQAFLAMSADAEKVVRALSSNAASDPSACAPGGKWTQTMWRNELSESLVPPRPSWYIGMGDAYGFHSGTYGSGPEFAYSSRAPVLWLQADNVSGTWEVSGFAGQQLTPDEYDSRRRPWYKSAANTRGSVHWSDVYLSIPENILVVAASMTWSRLAGDGATCGVVVAMMDLKGISEYLQQNRAGASEVWLVSNDDGDSLIASSTPASTYVVDATNTTVRGQMASSDDALTRAVARTARRIRGGRGTLDGLNKVSLLGDDYFLFITLADLRPGTGFPLVWVYVTVPVNVYFGGIQKNIAVTIATTVVLVVVSAALSSVVAVLISSPLRKVVLQMERASNLETVRETGRTADGKEIALSEVSSIWVSMHRMWLLLSSFHKYVPIEVLRLLQKNGEIAMLGVVRRPSTIMFCDIENFTVLTETTEPGVLLHVFTEFMDTATKCIDENGGLVDKFIGDCVMAFWGHPGKTEDREFRACSAAAAIRNRIGDLRESWKRRDMPQLRCRIGVASGDVLVGNSGSSNHFQYTVLGVPVNLAARLEPLNKYFGTTVIVCGATRAAVAGRMLTRTLGTCKIKGFAQPQDVFELIGDTEVVGPELAEATEVFNEAIDALHMGGEAEAVMMLERYLKMCPGDQYARRRLRELAGPDEAPDDREQFTKNGPDTERAPQMKHVIDLSG
eukprot:m51a1_g3952 putative adenylate guanylate cyclase (779) ;mRNA; f:337950-341069